MRITTSLALFILLALSLLGCALSHNYSPSQYILDSHELNEASGLAASQKTPGILFAHNDSGNEAIVYVINEKAMLAAKIILREITNHDWEDIAVGPELSSHKSCIYVADTGDNNAKRSYVSIYRFAEPALEDTLIYVTNVDEIKIQYEDGPRDLEAMFVDPITTDIYLISKREEKVGVYLVKYPYSLQDINVATKETTLPFSFVTAADISADGRQILVKTYTALYRYHRKKNQSIVSALMGKAKQLPYYLEPQGEAIAWDHEAKSYFSLSESPSGKPASLIHYR